MSDEDERQRIWHHVLLEIRMERLAQINKWGDQHHTRPYWLAILMEEVGELAQCIVQRKPYEDELIQCAAVCVAWLEDTHRGRV